MPSSQYGGYDSRHVSEWALVRFPRIVTLVRLNTCPRTTVRFFLELFPKLRKDGILNSKETNNNRLTCLNVRPTPHQYSKSSICRMEDS
ncbi:hypothetical protein TNCV_2112591 [Trichonephila clavipes]|nr:hypothetical protein TNCV_2112591 [Trichonephila clavipes]